MSKSPNLCDEILFEKFYKQNFKAANNFAFYKCGSSSDSLDLLQDSFAKIWENCASINYLKAKSYLFTTINHLFLNKVKHQNVVFAYQKETPNYDKDNHSPEYLYLEEEYKQQLLTKIAALPAQQRQIFLLNRIENKKYREIAELLNISQKTVEKHMSEALKNLQLKTKFSK
ncbi:sigma-70 family RNA polymerase sigma factor [Wenyingzhuangia sp. 2_MG-2023]|uniref:sigma-70 family RNA polymerase sigma factor n=1 Tax=Wenyingzhuangia sp. 2_MG-2023 TaxID=3062639 RepID=UPI0026E468B9|nr:sigma-70 family RNA polymerase sigma factor [Wenyingzhuangia sp. 2_MG-2023]MDO6736688.1 sigma-70 family RNA polymerase sigma factor [Wenyingzhuangia sp. 2_MG-2023]MDO6801017.1 sigma-70 family RNA polymerase sigma factor [Wenyingzhuangia sp. 1_MG-2023]